MPLAIGMAVRSTVDAARVGVIKGLGSVHAGTQFYQVVWAGGAGAANVAETDLLPHVESGTPSAALADGVVVGYAEFQRIITFQRLNREQPLNNNVYAFNASRTQFYPFQFKPLLKLIDSPTGRLLICDEVGLGKTIEAGLILLEERARREVRHSLVVCPSSLRTKWKIELERRFGLKFQILDAKAFREFLDDYDRHPASAGPANGIISLETIRAARVLSRLEEVAPAYDVVIVDEAHHLRNFGTRSRDTAAVLADAAGTLLLLTATPVHLGLENLFSLLNLLDPREFPDHATALQRFSDNEPVVAAQRLVAGGQAAAVDVAALVHKAASSPWLRNNPQVQIVLGRLAELADAGDTATALRLVVRIQAELTELNLLGSIFTRTRKRDVTIKVAVRDAHALEVRLTPRERQFYDAVSALVASERKLRAGAPIVVHWALNSIQRRLASSIAAMVQHYRAHPVAVDDQPEDDDVRPELAPASVQVDVASLRSAIQRLVNAWPDSEPDSKYDQLMRILRERKGAGNSGKMIVFAFFKGTLRHLARRLRADGFELVHIDGDVPLDERQRLIDRFRSDDSCTVMLSSRVGSEGLDFQFCDTLVNYDLPWNPMEVEQRIGRLDRIGQQAAKIQIYNFWTADTIESRILGRLYERIGLFNKSIGEMDAIMGEIVPEIDAVMMQPELTPEQQEREAERIAKVVEARLHDAERLEKQAASFIGVDAFFDSEIASIQKARRFVTGEQLFRFLDDYLRQRAPGTVLSYDSRAKRGKLVPDRALRSLLQQHAKAGELISLMGAEAGVAFTMDSETAYENPGLDFINVLHPLIEIVRDDYSSVLATRVSAQRVALRTSRLPQGAYLFFVYRLDIRGSRQSHFLESVFVDEHCRAVCSRDEAEELLGEMVESGAEPATLVGVESAFAAEAARAAEQEFLGRLQERRREIEARNTAVLERKAASVKFSLEAQIVRQRDVLQRQTAEGREERILQLARGKIAKLSGDMERQLTALDAQRKVAIDHVEVAAGILEVVS